MSRHNVKIETLPLGQLAAKLGETTRQIQRVVDEGFATKPKKKGAYDVWAVVRGIIRYYKGKSGTKLSEARDIDAARKARAEADTAELIAGEKSGKLMFTADAGILWADLIIEWRKVIQSKAQWDSPELLVRLSKIKPSPKR